MSGSQKCAKFRQLHESGCFVIPNPWDRGTAKFLEGLGFKALATTSAGFGFSLGVPDQIGALPVDTVLEHIRELVEATSLPVSADFQEGYANTPEGVEKNVSLCIATGIAGLSIEDATGNRSTPMFEKPMAISRIRAAKHAINSSTRDVFLTARCEAWLVRDSDPLRTAIDRLKAYAEAGADCLFAPGVQKPEEISAIVKAVHPIPVNVLVGRANPQLSVSRLAELGVRRISVGSAFSRVAWNAFMKSAKNLLEDGTFECLSDAASFEAINYVLTERV